MARQSATAMAHRTERMQAMAKIQLRYRENEA
jgi:hypothetical protein